MKNRICAALLTLVLCLPLAGCAGRGFLRYIRFLPGGGALFWCGFRYAGQERLYRGASSSRWNTPLWTRSGRPLRRALPGLRLAGGYTVEVVYKNAQGDPTAIRTIAEQFAAQGVDVIVPIATGAAQGAAAAAQNVPIVFSAVADPVAAGAGGCF